MRPVDEFAPHRRLVFPDALGLDSFTVYGLIQRDRLTPITDDEGVVGISEEEVNQLAQRKKE
jgi:hypothetical protein